ncbi:MAG: FAD-dependent oxidoreductase, partial [Ghiorsea sp.]
MQAFNTYDILVVGQGLAGSLLAWSLQQQGLSTFLISNEKESASRVAAGIINPVTGQRFVLAETTPQMLKHAASFYQTIEQALHISCYHPTPLLWLFKNEKAHFTCQKRLQQAQYQAFLQQTTLPDHLQANYSGIAQQHTAWLDTNCLLDALLQQFKNNHRYQSACFYDHEVCLHQQHVTWQGIQAKKIIFCEGYQMMNNPFFDWLPMQPAHGEIISCQTSAPLDPHIINQSKWLLPTA